MFGIENNEKRKKESSLILRKAKFQAIFKFVLPLASKGTEGIKYNLNFLRIGRSLEKFFPKNFRDDSFTFGFAKVKTLSFLRLRGASGAQGISAPASCREAHKRRFIFNSWILHFAFAPFRMTIPTLALLFTLVTISESRADRCETSGIVTQCYNDKEQITSSQVNYENGTKAIVVYNYDEITGKKTTSTQKNYDANNNLTYRIEETYVNNRTDKRTDYTYTNGVITSEHYHVYNGHGGQAEEGSYVKNYDLNGNVTSSYTYSHEYNPNASNKWSVYHRSNYNSSGIKTSEQLNTYSNDGKSYIVNYDYLRPDGSISSTSGTIYTTSTPYGGTSNSSGATKTNYNMNYDVNGNLTNSSKSTSVYDNNKNLHTTHNEQTNADGSGYSYDYGYDDSWHQTSQNYVSKDKDGNITNDYGYTWTYDENGRRTDENFVRKDGNGNITETRDSEWTYNDDGNQTEYSYERKDGDGNMLDYGTEQNEYNADGNQISRDYNAYYGNGQLMDSEQNTYVYDDDGNEIHNEYINKEYYENGQISYDEHEEWDEVTGSKDFEKEYYEDGTLRREYQYIDNNNGVDTTEEKSYYENGQLSYEYESYDYPDGTWNSSQKDYYENGQLSQTNVWGTDENGIYTDNYVYYDENGNITSEENYTRNPDGTWTRDNMYYEYDDDGKLISRTNEICNNDGCSSVSYDANGDLLSVNDNKVTENCASADSNGVCTKCKDGFDDIDGYCNKIRWTPAEAAKVLRDDNTNEVTITFKKR